MAYHPLASRHDPRTNKEDLCLQALAHQPNKRNQEMLNHIKSYLKSMPSFMNIISKEKNTNIGENLIEQISVHLRHEYIPKNNLCSDTYSKENLELIYELIIEVLKNFSEDDLKLFVIFVTGSDSLLIKDSSIFFAFITNGV